MRRIFLLTALLYLAYTATAQPTQNVAVQPNCFIRFSFPSGTASFPATTVAGGPGDNRTKGCSSWYISYQSLGYTVVSLLVESGKSTTTTVTYGAFAGTVVSGVNPQVSTTGTTATLANGTAAVSWIRVTATLTGSGTLTGALIGYASAGGGAGGGGGGSGCAGTALVPCVVDGPTASGSPPTFAPVLVAGQDGTNLDTLKTDTAGQLIPANTSTAQADGVSNTQSTPTGAAGAVLYPRVAPSIFNGSTWDRQFTCASQAAITFTAASGSLQIVALTASQIIRICHISLASDTVTNITLQYGTGSNCGTGTTAISGAYANVTAMVLDFGPLAAPRTAASNAFCVSSSATATIGGLIVYSKY